MTIGLTYPSQAAKDVDRDRQRELIKALGASDLALRLDECGAWRVYGKHGHIYTWGDDAGDGWVMWVACQSSNGWTRGKRRLSFCEVRQDGDDEGALRLRELPAAAQAVVIRSVLGLKRRRPAETAAHLRRQEVLEVPTEGDISAPEHVSQWRRVIDPPGLLEGENTRFSVGLVRLMPKPKTSSMSAQDSKHRGKRHDRGAIDHHRSSPD